MALSAVNSTVGVIQVIECVFPKGVTENKAGAGCGFMVKVVMSEHPPAAIMVAEYGPGLTTPFVTLYCVGVKIPFGMEDQVMV